MPGPYSKPQGVSIVGGGGSGVSKKNMTKKHLRRKAMDKPVRKAMAKKLALPVWEDRNLSIRGSKLGG